MEAFTVIVSPSATQARVLATRGPDELVRACFPLLSLWGHHRGAWPTFLEGLALILDARPRVVLAADAQQCRSCLGLTDWDGCAQSALLYDVEVVAPLAAPGYDPPPRRLRRAEFADLHRLQLRNGGA